ncbi:hypothetical protein BFJ63_vAg16394 [Fusarium oxysporum f. sp. narcissi]|uniref:Uncharacterized protein n=1 Tax=Fusarium oxysporum f. sp. narcissi TaxID=451672 RepID=A0A4Q2V6T9_FUSOX|nr:hypothetical protein BFJ63_vAg16394 [Fusarium oxysporum f. sp. narcissi]
MDSSEEASKKAEGGNISDRQPIKEEQSNESNNEQQIDMAPVLRDATEEEKKTYGLEPFTKAK